VFCLSGTATTPRFELAAREVCLPKVNALCAASWTAAEGCVPGGNETNCCPGPVPPFDVRWKVYVGVGARERVQLRDSGRFLCPPLLLRLVVSPHARRVLPHGLLVAPLGPLPLPSMAGLELGRHRHLRLRQAGQRVRVRQELVRNSRHETPARERPEILQLLRLQPRLERGHRVDVDDRDRDQRDQEEKDGEPGPDRAEHRPDPPAPARPHLSRPGSGSRRRAP
jgi:hypothetical protein